MEPVTQSEESSSGSEQCPQTTKPLACKNNNTLEVVLAPHTLNQATVKKNSVVYTSNNALIDSSEKKPPFASHITSLYK